MRFFNFKRRTALYPSAWEAATPEQLEVRALPLLKLCLTTLEAVDSMLVSPASMESTTFETKLATLRDSIGQEFPAIEQINRVRKESRDSIREIGHWQRKELDQLQRELTSAIRALVEEIRSALHDQENLLGDFGDFSSRLESIQSSDNIQEIKNGLCSEINVAKRIIGWQSAAHTQLRDSYEEAVEGLEHHVSNLSEANEVDPLTGLFTRNAFEGRLAEARHRASSKNSALALALVDLDDFRRINAENGRQAGDMILGLFARHLQAALGQDSIIARCGNDEFTVMFEGFTGLFEKKLSAALHSLPELRLPKGIHSHGPSINLRASAGITSLIDDEPLMDSMQRVEAALHEARRAGGGCIRTREAKKAA